MFTCSTTPRDTFDCRPLNTRHVNLDRYAEDWAEPTLEIILISSITGDPKSSQKNSIQPVGYCSTVGKRWYVQSQSIKPVIEALRGTEKG